MKALKTCGCSYLISRAKLQASDAAIEVSAEELQMIRTQTSAIERMLGAIFGEAYSRGPASLKARGAAADLAERHLEGIVEQWRQAVERLFGARDNGNAPTADADHRRETFSNALVRFITHLRDPDNIETYVYLRKHCQEGMLARMGPGQFNLVHIALKQVLLNHVRNILHGQRMEIARDAIVAAIDERRLMVSQFYIESREKALRASEEKYRNAINHAPDPMYEIDVKNGVIIAANSAAERLISDFGKGPVSAVGHSITELVPPEIQAETMKHFKNVLVQGSDQVHDVPLYLGYFDVNSALIPFGNNQFIQTILHDVTQKREMMNELLKAERLAATGTFAAGVAHEVNNPLASISSLVQSLLSGEDDAGRRMTLHTILSQITRISATLKDLMNFSRPTTAERKQLDLNALVSDTLRLLRFNKRFAGTTIEPNLAPDLEPVFADENEIQQVLLNLLFNAADATPNQAGSIHVITRNKSASANGERPEKVILQVGDNGIGIPKEHLERVFDPFFTTKGSGSGVGLGLSLCQRIILANGGTIGIDSEVGKGTTVTITLHAYRPQETVAARAAQ